MRFSTLRAEGGSRVQLAVGGSNTHWSFAITLSIALRSCPSLRVVRARNIRNRCAGHQHAAATKATCERISVATLDALASSCPSVMRTVAALCVMLVGCAATQCHPAPAKDPCVDEMPKVIISGRQLNAQMLVTSADSFCFGDARGVLDDNERSSGGTVELKCQSIEQPFDTSSLLYLEISIPDPRTLTKESKIETTAELVVSPTLLGEDRERRLVATTTIRALRVSGTKLPLPEGASKDFLILLKLAIAIEGRAAIYVFYSANLSNPS